MARPYKLSISSRDLKREKMIGTYASLGNAIRKARYWQNRGYQSSGCLLYIVSNVVGREYVIN